jgi:4,5-dihydroxyphthalate decarboxylase
MSTNTTSHLKMVLPPSPWTKAMDVEGAVRVPGLTWETDTNIANAPERFVATHAKDVDLGENGLRRYIIDRLKGVPATAIPVFFGRESMLRTIWVRDGDSITEPKDLEGKRLGSHLTAISGTGAAVFMMLEQAFGVALDKIALRMGDPERLPDNKLGLNMQQPLAQDELGFDQLASGEIDAVMITTGPRYYSMFGNDPDHSEIEARPGIRPLISDVEVMADAYRRTGLYPISDLVVMRQETVAADPESAAKAVDALSQANELAPSYRDAAEQALADREIALLGLDVHKYTLGTEQRKNVAAFTEFLYRMGAIESYIEPDELFVPGTV